MVDRIDTVQDLAEHFGLSEHLPPADLRLVTDSEVEREVEHWDRSGAQKCIDSGVHRVSARHTPGDCPLMAATHHPCSALLAGHRHCRHGHTEDCPDPDNCELLPTS